MANKLLFFFLCLVLRLGGREYQWPTAKEVRLKKNH